MINLQIVEVDYSVSPGGETTFEVYDKQEVMDPPIFETNNLIEAVNYCYKLGQDFEVKTLAQWEKENN